MTHTTTLNAVGLEAVAALTEAIRQEPNKGTTTWRADVEWKGGFRSEARIRDFAPLTSDEPASLGGNDSAPNPVEQLLAALGNCLAVGYAANATAAGITLRGLRITVEGDLDLHTFLGLRPGHAGFLTIQAEVEIDIDAPEKELRSLHEQVVSTSPVGHTLSKAIPVDVKLV